MQSLKDKTVLITGASSGIGAACARAFAREGSHLILTARRKSRIDDLAQRLSAECGVRAYTSQFDVQVRTAVDSFVASLPASFRAIDILINNAGLSRGLDKLYEGSIQDWEEMIDTNIKGLLYMTRAIVPGMVQRKSGQIINLGSIAGHQVYPNGNVYCATKFAVRALTEGLKMDLLGTGVKVCAISPGLVETEFSLVRFHGNAQRASQTYAHTHALQAEDIAETAIFCATRPPHVDISEVIMMSTDQASVHHVHKTS
jgi:3-hydroxy acid dehydrogenase / malonic semialdehyde reductase